MKKTLAILIASVLLASLITALSNPLSGALESNEVATLSLKGINLPQLHRDGIFPDENGFELMESLDSISDQMLRDAVVLPGGVNENTTIYVIGSGHFRQPMYDDQKNISYSNESKPVIIIYVDGLDYYLDRVEKVIPSQALVLITKDGEWISTTMISVPQISYTGTPIRSLKYLP